MPLGFSIIGSTVTFDLFLRWATQGSLGPLVFKWDRMIVKIYVRNFSLIFCTVQVSLLLFIKHWSFIQYQSHQYKQCDEYGGWERLYHVSYIIGNILPHSGVPWTSLHQPHWRIQSAGWCVFCWQCCVHICQLSELPVQVFLRLLPEWRWCMQSK